jgi:REP element-mobilizing transposase RayT
MVLASHVIFSTYGFWLPNDPRGSWSEFVGAWELFRFGRATKVDTRRSVAAAPHDLARRMAAKAALKYPPVCFSGVQARAVGRGFAAFAARTDLTVWACSILPEHVHMVVARHRYPAEQVVTLLKGAATRQLLHEDLHPLAAFGAAGSRPPPPWARGEWKVFLSDAEAIERAVRYVERNPLKEDKPVQQWSFVTAPSFDALRR